MQVTSLQQTEIAQAAVDAIVITVPGKKDDVKVELGPIAAEVDRLTKGLVLRLIDEGEISTSELSCTRLFAPSGLRATSLIVVGLGNRTEKQSGLAYRVAGAAAKFLSTKQRRQVIMALDLEPQDEIVAGAMVGCQGQDLYKKQKKTFPIDKLLLVNGDAQAMRRGEIIGEAVNLTRRLVNLPANEIYPETFAEECSRQAKAHSFAIEVWDQERLIKERCRALLAVGQGSAKPARLVIMKYSGAPADHPTIALVGKGVTFDSGGLSIKPNEGMIDMKCDMAGAATVLGAMTALVRLNVPANVIALVGLAENMIGGNSFKLGDVLTSRNGKTIEVLNTDAEGRLVLADVLDVALSLQAHRIVDVATLTGACMVALGRHVVGGMTNNESWYADVRAAADQCGEPLWQLPMFADFSEHIRSAVADLKNIGDGRWGGAITAAKFLEEFVGDRPWVHLDIAGPSFSDKGYAWVDAGASGCFVRTLVQLIENLA
jgi:leucyl aminopeptidase